MIRITVCIVGLAFLASCGADGEPIPPKVSGSTAIGVNSNTGVFTKTKLAVTFGGN